MHTTDQAQSQIVRWGPSDGLPAGIWINTRDGEFIPWDSLKTELEERLLNQVGRHVPANSQLVIQDHFDRKDWIMRITDSAGKEIGSVWLGGNPHNDWKFDGLVRIGKTISDSEWEVWQTFQRFSDGSYRRV